MVVFGRYTFGQYPFGGPGLIPVHSDHIYGTAIITQAPVPAPPHVIGTAIVTMAGAKSNIPGTAIVQDSKKLILDLVNADKKQGGNAVYDKELTL